MEINGFRFCAAEEKRRRGSRGRRAHGLRCGWDHAGTAASNTAGGG